MSFTHASIMSNRMLLDDTTFSKAVIMFSGDDELALNEVKESSLTRLVIESGISSATKQEHPKPSIIPLRSVAHDLLFPIQGVNLGILDPARKSW